MTTAERHGIVVGIDGSEACRRAIAWATPRTDRFGPIRPVHAWEYPTTVTAATPFGPGPIPSASELEASALALSEESLTWLGDAPHLDPVVTRGDAGEVLVDVAADAELLVVGTRSRGAVRANLLGSIGRHCADHTPVPLVIVPHHDLPPVGPPEERIVVGVDGTDHGAAALDWAIAAAHPSATITAVTAWHHAIDAPFPPHERADDRRDLHTVAERTVEQAVAGACSRTGVDPSRVRTMTAEGDPRQVLLTAATDADLLVLGQRGRSGLKHLLLGSTTTTLIHRPVCPVAVVPAQA